MAREQSEKEFQRDYVRWIKAQDPLALAIKLSTGDPRTSGGWPDILIVKPMLDGNAVVGFNELKARGKKPTARQDVRIKQLCMAGANVTWTDNMEDAQAFYRNLKI